MVRQVPAVDVAHPVEVDVLHGDDEVVLVDLVARDLVRAVIVGVVAGLLQFGDGARVDRVADLLGGRRGARQLDVAEAVFGEVLRCDALGHRRAADVAPADEHHRRHSCVPLVF